MISATIIPVARSNRITIIFLSTQIFDTRLKEPFLALWTRFCIQDLQTIHFAVNLYIWWEWFICWFTYILSYLYRYSSLKQLYSGMRTTLHILICIGTRKNCNSVTNIWIQQPPSWSQNWLGRLELGPVCCINVLMHIILIGRGALNCWYYSEISWWKIDQHKTWSGKKVLLIQSNDYRGPQCTGALKLNSFFKYQHFYTGESNCWNSLSTRQIQDRQSWVKQYNFSGKTDLRVLCMGVKCIMVSAFTMYWSRVHLCKNRNNDW